MSVPHLAADNPDILLPRPVCMGRMVKVLLPQGLFQEDLAWTETILGNSLHRDDCVASTDRPLLRATGLDSLLSSLVSCH